MISGTEFVDRGIQILIFFKALYCLLCSGLRFHERFADCLRDIRFFMWKLEPDIWIRQNGYIYEYISVYVYDSSISEGILRTLWIHLKTNIISILREQYQFNFTLDVISSVTVIVFYDFHYTNILKIWSRPICLCLVQIQNYTSLSGPLYNKVIIQILINQICWIMMIPRNINTSLVPWNCIFP